MDAKHPLWRGGHSPGLHHDLELHSMPKSLIVPAKMSHGVPHVVTNEIQQVPLCPEVWTCALGGYFFHALFGF